MTSNKCTSWRDVLPIHPAAELFPMMSEQDLRQLGADISKRGLLEGVAVLDGALLDGRNRLDAMELVGMKVLAGNKLDVAHRNVQGVDPYDFIVSKNIHRRHLSPEQKRELIAQLLTATPEKSNRQIAETVKVDHKTVASVRAEKRATGEIPQLTKTVGKDGRARKRPKHRQPTTIKQRNPAIAAAVERTVARSEESQRSQTLVSASAAAASAAQDPPKANAVSERFTDFAMFIAEETARLGGKQRTEFLLYLRAVIDGLLQEANATVDCVP